MGSRLHFRSVRASSINRRHHARSIARSLPWTRIDRTNQPSQHEDDSAIACPAPQSPLIPRPSQPHASPVHTTQPSYAAPPHILDWDSDSTHMAALLDTPSTPYGGPTALDPMISRESESPPSGTATLKCCQLATTHSERFQSNGSAVASFPLGQTPTPLLVSVFQLLENTPLMGLLPASQPAVPESHQSPAFRGGCAPFRPGSAAWLSRICPRICWETVRKSPARTGPSNSALG